MSLRARWGRADRPLDLSLAELTILVQPAFPEQHVVDAEPTHGGLANTNIRLQLDRYPRPVLLRLSTRRAERSYDVPPSVAKESALHRLLAPRLPVPRVLFEAPDNPITGHPYLLREWVDGERLEVIAPRLERAALDALGHHVGAVLAGIHAVTFPEQGFVDDALAVVPFPPGIVGNGLAGSLRTFLGARGIERLGPELTQALFAFAERDEHVDTTWSGPPCLIHADFGGSNILVGGGPPAARVAGVVDWEFAYAGSPFSDFGNLLRPPLGDLPGFEAAVARGYRAAGGRLPDNWRRRSLQVDLTSWAAFLGRPSISQALADDARRMIARTIGGPARPS